MYSIFHLDDLEERKERCFGKIIRYATMGALNGLNPMPGVNVGVDVGICLKMMADIREEFGLTEAMRVQLQSYEMLVPLLNAVFSRATQAGVSVLLKELLRDTTSHTVLSLIPVIGQGISAALGFVVIRKLGNNYVDDCYRLTKEAIEIAVVDAEYSE